ncbi:MAG: PAS domain S-box protein [Desulfomonilaceae bacterium]
MKNFSRSYTEKINSLMSAFSARSGTSLEEERKIRFFTLVTFLAIPIFIGFLILHLSQGTAAHPVILLLAGACQVLSLLALKRLKNPKVAFRICASVLGVYFLFLIGEGGAHGTMLWMLIMPAYFFFVLGKGEGLVWTAAGFLASLFILSDPTGLFSTYHYERTVAARFLLTYGLIAAIAYFGESTRERYAEQLLDVQTQRFQTLCAHAPFGMVIIDKDGDFRYANPKFKEIFGYDLSDVPNGREWFQKAYPDSAYRHKTIAAWKEALEGLSPGKTRSKIFEVTCKDGSRKIIQFRPVKLVTGEDLMTCEDITDRIRAEETLRIRDSAMASSITGIWIADFAGTLTYVNPAALRLWGYDDEREVLGRRAVELFVMDERAKEGWKTAAKTGSWLGEVAAKRKDGSNVEIQVVATVVRDNDGKAIAIMGSALDITDRKRAEQALRESEGRYRSLFEESRDAVIMTTRDGVLEDANQAFFDLFGFTREEAQCMDILNIYLGPADRLRFQRDIERAGSVKDYPVKRRKKDGTEIDCLLTAAARRGKNGTILGYQGIVRDVTDLNRLTRQLLQAQKMEAIGTLAGGIAHDFNNLLQVTMGYSEVLLSRKDKTDPEYARLQQILQAGRSGAELVQRLLTLSRKTESKQRPIDLNHHIKQVQKLLDRTIPKMIKIELHLENSLATVSADPVQIDQIIMNLAVNARDAMPEGGKLTLSTENVTMDEEYCRVHPGAKPGKYLLLAILDTGTGMDQEILEHLFEPFFTTKGAGTGTGLGLAVVYGIVKQHGGYITCDSEPGKGTMFRIYLPAIEEQEIVSDKAEEQLRLPGGTETILLVDDEDVVRHLGELILGETGYKVLTAKNGREALEMYRKEGQSISLVIMDLIMPEMGGMECLKQLLRNDPQVNVVVASGYSADASVKETIRMGAKGFVSKPFRLKELLREVRRVLDEGTR